jgi:hypothetical protein
MNAEGLTSARIEVALLRNLKRAHQREEIARPVSLEQIIAIFAHLLAFRSAKNVPPLRKRCHERDSTHTAVLLSSQQHSRVTRMKRGMRAFASPIR